MRQSCATTSIYLLLSNSFIVRIKTRRMINKGKVIQFIAVFTGTLTIISDGMQYAWTSAVTPILFSKESPLVVTSNDMFWLEYTLFFAALIGIPFSTYATERLGRKISILIAAGQYLLAWILIGTTSSLSVLFVGRTLSGISSVLAFVAALMYISEIADKEIRGFLSSWIALMLLTGVMVINVLGPSLTILSSSMIAASFPLLLLVTFPFMPESPYFYILNGKLDDARNSLRKLRSRSNVEEELEQIILDILRQQSEKGRPIDLFIIPSNRKALCIMAVVNGAQHMCGFSVILMNLQQILMKGNSYFDVNTICICFTLALIGTVFCSTCLVDKLGRRFLLLISSALTGTTLTCLAFYYGFGSLQKSANWIPDVLIIIYAVSVPLGLGTVPIVTTGELFPTNVKSIGMGLSVSLYTAFSIISVFAYQMLSQTYGIYSVFLLFAICTLTTATYTYFYIPETTGKSLEEIQMILKGTPDEALKPSYGTTRF